MRQFSTFPSFSGFSQPTASSPVSSTHRHVRRHPFNTIINLENRRYFESESAYHRVADETLEEIQDAVEMAMEDLAPTDNYEVVLASGVLTMTLPPHGTWVLNKQTPNRVSFLSVFVCVCVLHVNHVQIVLTSSFKQIWWSSPLSGPRRYEYEDGEWVFTRDESHSMTLKDAMAQEFQEIYGIVLELE
jgi:frataxin